MTIVNYSLVINGAATKIFTLLIGLREICPLSPYLFLFVMFVMEGLRRTLNEVKLNHNIQGNSFGEEVSITHTLWVDNVLLFLRDSDEEDNEMKENLYRFSKDQMHD